MEPDQIDGIESQVEDRLMRGFKIIGAEKDAMPLKRIAGGVLAIALSIMLAFPACPVATVDAYAANPDNSWQIVERKYDANYSTSEGLSSEELDGHNFVESEDGQVRVSKSVEPTEVEDEFIVHLSVDATATSKQVSDYKSFFENAPYQATTSNGYNGYTPGIVTSDKKGTMNVQVSGKTPLGGNSAVFDIMDPQGRPIAENVTLYWSQANKVSILLKIQGKYILMGVSVTKGTTNDLWISEEAYEMIQSEIADEVKQGNPTKLDSVCDPIGEEMEYLGSATANGGSVFYDSDERTLYWKAKGGDEDSGIEYSDACKVVVEDPVVTEELNGYGAVTKVTVTQLTHYYGAVSLTYRVRLNTGKEGFKSSYDPESETHPYETNGNASHSDARLSYTFYTDGGEDIGTGEVSFPKPKVKGVLYDLRLQKTNEIGTPLAGATFKLTRTWKDSLGQEHKDIISDSVTSDSEGYVTCTSLPWGTYTLEETGAPAGHYLPKNASERTATFNLCYTSNADVLTVSSITGKDEHHASLKNAPPIIVNERVKTDVTLLKVDSETSTPVEGARFALYEDNGDGVFSEADDLKPEREICELETDEGGTIKFKQLTVGAYYLVETYTPAGYELNEKVFRIEVYDVEGEAGGGEGNMIRVGDAKGLISQAPSTPNTITIADTPIPSLPLTAGLDITGYLACGMALVGFGCGAIAVHEARSRRRLKLAKWRIK